MHNPTIITSLEKIGLNEKETAIYLAALELGQDSISHIAKKAGIKRPTAYCILEELQKRGLVSTATKGKRTLWGAEEPAKLHGIIAEKSRALNAILPYLEAINNRRAEKPRVRFFEGREGIQRIYEEGFKSKEMRFWGSIDVVKKNIPDVLTWFEHISRTERPKTYDLLTDTPEDRAYAKRVARPGYEIRFFPKDLPVAVDSMLFENKISICAFAPEPHGLIIESESMATSFRSLWELAWRGATPYKK